jgi:hypothetical protein
MDLIDSCIQEARPEEDVFLSDIIAALDLQQFLTRVLSEPVCRAFEAIIQVCRRRILVTLDGFDTAFDEFRRTGIDHYYADELLEDRAHMEIEWVRSLLHLVMEIKHDYRRPEPFYGLLDFCLTIPKDRFLEIMQIERDSYIYHDRYTELNWSGPELAILLRKRLELLTGYRTEKKLDVQQRLSQVIDKNFANIPKESYVYAGGRKHFMPLFLYVLRHTFWRPRDILFYFARILAVAKDMHERKYLMTDDVVRKIVKDTTMSVISSEFIGEFRSTVTNIREIIEVFKGHKQIMSYEETQACLAKAQFVLSNRTEGMKDCRSKFIFLYQIGFLGFDVDEDMKNRYGIECKQAFYFNEGTIPLRVLDTPGFSKCRFVVHPVFCEYLQLDTMSQEATLDFDWDYLRRTEPFIFGL